MPKGVEHTHDASASAEVVVGPKICLYWSRDSRYVAGLGVPAALLPALPDLKSLRGGVAIWVAC
jgi:hypothetical protein